MKVTAKVFKGNKITGYIVDNKFVSRENIKRYNDKMPGVVVGEDGLIKANYDIPRVPEKNIKKQSQKIEFKRDVTGKLQEWYSYSREQILFVQGARQVGKTFEVKRFAKNYFKNVIYVNLSADSLFTDKVKNRGAKPIKTVLQSYCKDRGFKFKDSEETVLIIDEIQLSLETFNILRSFKNDIESAVIVTGSYLGFLVNRKAFFPAGDLYSVEMTPLTFKEFCTALEVPYTDSQVTLQAYEVYRQIGGYPSIVKTYIQRRDIGVCMEALGQLWKVFCTESDAYVEYAPCVDVFNECMSKVLIQMSKEKSGLKDLVEADEEKVVTAMTQYTGRENIIANKIIKTAFNWLQRAGLLGICKMHKDGNVRNAATDYRYYIRDVGLANYLIRLNGRLSSEREGTLTECFAYNELSNSAKIVAGGTPHCAVYQGYELDFIFVDKNSDNVYGIEVKTKNNGTASLHQFKQKKLITIMVKAGRTHYSKDGKGLINYPVYLIGGLGNLNFPIK